MKSRKWTEDSYRIYYGLSQQGLIQQVYRELHGGKPGGVLQEKYGKSWFRTLPEAIILEEYGVEDIQTCELAKRI